MKKILFGLLFLLSVSLFAQESFQTMIVDSVSNSITKTSAALSLKDLGTIDSIAVSVYAMGEIDLDSLYFTGGLVYVAKDYLKYKGTTGTAISIYEDVTGGAVTLTINSDSASASYVQNALVLTKAELTGYTHIKANVIAASSGNDATDPTQKVIVVATVYKPVTYQK